MKNYIAFLIVILITTILGCNTSQSLSHNEVHARMPSEPGKCYAKCSIQAQYGLKKTEVSYAVYTGDPTLEDVDLDTITIEVSPSSSNWVKRKADRNCLSANPEDCLVWCLVNTPAQVQEVPVLLDTTQSQNFQYHFETQALIKEGGFTEWREVVCNSDITPKFYRKVQQALVDAGYDIGPMGVDGIVSKSTKSALIKFQEDTGLPFGNLDHETLDAMGISIP